ncbi:MAG TPA: type II toxin-antitoxin system RelE/ParE family toxin, partial [Thermoanaerobaculia bacterium]|nr:type II toxin-antitoxin system RelE/ParE family toxin [Thermoanaerobaculia bacterium]
MTRRVHVSKRAAEQIRRAAGWWRTNRSAHGLFDSELARGFDLITAHPGIGIQVISPDDIPGLRRLHLPRIRYSIYYRPTESETIEVVAVWHSSR